MKKLLKRSKLKRNLFSIAEKKIYIYKSLTNNKNLIKNMRWNADNHVVKNSISLIHLTNRCIVTGRKNILNENYRLSRITFLQYTRKGLIPNIIKSVW